MDKLKQKIIEAVPEIITQECPNCGKRVSSKEKGYHIECGGYMKGGFLRGLNIKRRPIRLDDTAIVVKDKHYLIDNWKIGILDDQDPKLIKWILKTLK